MFRDFATVSSMRKAGMLALPEGEESTKTCLSVSTQSVNVTDGKTDRTGVFVQGKTG